MRYINQLPYEVKVIDHTLIPMSDGANLAAKIWMPHEAKKTPLPAVIEYEPYRKRDLLAIRDSMMHGYFAGQGYVAVRVEMRGTGESDGVLTDEYLPLEIQDGLDILKWVASQPWCTGSVGMIGKSWGGFNGLQIAALRPPELKAVITVCFSDDRYADDVHYMGGCLLGDNLSWASTMYAYTALPPDPVLVGDKWRDMWLNRARNSGFWLRQWLEHQHRDDYWKHGSICEDYSSIQCPVFAISGWADGYTNAVFRLMENLHAPRLGLIGPWGHAYPHQGVPGPAIGFLQEAVRFWDACLKGQNTGIMQEPMLRVWMQYCLTPERSQLQHPGEWVGENQWPTANIHWRAFNLYHSLLTENSAHTEAKQTTQSIQSPLTVGLFAGKWCSYDAPPDLPHDQRQEDGGALVFDSGILDSRLAILGAPLLELRFSVDKPVAMVAARLSDIAPDGQVTRVTYGLLNLNHHNSHEHPEPLTPGELYTATIQLNDVAYTFEQGHRLRLALSTSYWPLAWPPPELFELTVYTPASTLKLPERKKNNAIQATDQAISFEEPVSAKPVPYQQIRKKDIHWWVKRELAQDISILDVIKDNGTVLFTKQNWQITYSSHESYTIDHNRCNSAVGECNTRIAFRRDNWEATTHIYTRLSSDKQNFYIHAQIDALENEQRLFSDNIFHTIKRRLL